MALPVAAVNTHNLGRAQVAPLSSADDRKPSDPGAEASVAAAEQGALSENTIQAKRQKKKKRMEEFTLREKIYATMEDPGYSSFAKFIAIFMMVVIVVSTICFILESEVCQSESCNDPGVTGFLEFDPAAKVFYVIEWISVVIFTIDYNIRLFTCPKLIPFVFGVMNLVDLVAWLPFWIMGFTGDPPFAEPSLDSSDVGGVGFVRAVRLIRVFRVFKVGKYSLGIQMFGGALARSLQPMLILVLVLTVAMIIFSSIMWLVERPGGVLVTDELLAITGMGPGDGFDEGMQSLCFGTIPRAFWWALTTMTTVGYGDCYPITTPGKLVCVCAMICGVITLALPITVLGSNFAKMVEMYEEDEAQYSFSDLSGDGLVDELELREFLIAKKNEGLLRKDVDVKISSLMKKYDTEDQGALSRDAFRRLAQEICIQKAFDPQLEMQHMKDILSLHSSLLSEMTTAVKQLCVHQGVPGAEELVAKSSRLRERMESGQMRGLSGEARAEIHAQLDLDGDGEVSLKELGDLDGDGVVDLDKTTDV